MERRKKNRAVRGFSLLELMLVIAIMGALMAVVAYNLLGVGDKAKKRATEATLMHLKGALDSYHLEKSEWPPDLKTLITTSFLTDQKLADGWSTDVLYDPRAANGHPYSLFSAGPDKVVGNEDDIDAWLINK